MKRAVALLIVLILGQRAAAQARSGWVASQTIGMHVIHGPFVQRDYGFSVEAPKDATAYVTDGGTAEHGVRIILGERREIDVYPEYTEPDGRITQPCQRDQFPRETTSSTGVSSALLGAQTACLMTFISHDQAWGVIQATGEDRGQGIMYSLVLTTTREALDADLVPLRQVALTFKRVAVEP